VIGTVVVAGVAFEVTEIRLTGGRFVIIACHPGPVPGLRGPATLFGADGKGILQSWEELTIPHVCGIVTLVLPVTITEITNVPGPGSITWR